MNGTESEKDKIPHWNLDSIFTSIDSSEYKKAKTDCTNGIKNLEELIARAHNFDAKCDFAAWLAHFLEADESVKKLIQTLVHYAYIVYSVDTTNMHFLHNLTEVEAISNAYEQTHIAFSTLLCAHSHHLHEFYTRFPEFAQYRYLIDEKIDGTKHQMSAEAENLAADMQQTGGSAWERLHEQIISNLKSADGKTFNEIRNDAYSPDAALRKKSYETEISLLRTHKIALAACLNNIKGETLMLNKRRNWRSPIDRALFANRMTRQTIDALISAIEESLPALRSYFSAKAAWLRANGLTASADATGIAFYDLFAPLAVPQQKTDAAHADSENALLTRKWTFSEAETYITDRYNSFSTEMGSFAESVFAQNWIDAEIRQGKVGGAYNEDIALGHQSRILTNFSGTFGDVITLAHEIGHAYHFSCMKNKPSSFFDYPMVLAETASTFAETIVKQDAIQNCTGAEKLQILDSDLQDVTQVLVDILCRFYFEQSVFDEKQNAPLSAEDFCRLMRDAQERTYGSALNSETHEYMWAVKSHYYSPELDFYNFPYAFGQLLASSLYFTFKKNGADCARIYSQFLSETGNAGCEEICKKIGFDITTKEFWLSGIEPYIHEIEAFKKLAE